MEVIMQRYSAYRKMSVKREVGAESLNTFWFDSACRIWPVGPAWTDPGVFHKIKSGFWMVRWPLCPLRCGLMIALRIREPTQTCDFSKHVSQVLESQSDFKYHSRSPEPSELILSSQYFIVQAIICSLPSAHRNVTEFFAQTTCPNFRFRKHDREPYEISFSSGKGWHKDNDLALCSKVWFFFMQNKIAPTENMNREGNDKAKRS